MKKFVTDGPKLKPVQSESCWRDTRPAPHAMTHGVYHPVLDTRSPKVPEWAVKITPEAPIKPRDTV